MRWKTGIFGLLVILSLSVCPFSNAFADAAVPVDNDKALNFIIDLASASELAPTVVVGTVANMASIATGISFSSGDINLQNTLSNNLHALKDGTGYGGWEELSSSDQQAWGSEDNYNAAKFNSFIGAFGLDDARDRYYAAQGDFSFTSEELDILADLHDIGDTWLTNGTVLVSDITNMIKNEDDFAGYIGTASYSEIDTTKIDGIPTGYPAAVNLNKTNIVHAHSQYTNSNGTSTYDSYQVWGANIPAYCVLALINNGTQLKTNMLWVNESTFTHGYNRSNSSNINPINYATATTGSLLSNVFYYGVNLVNLNNIVQGSFTTDCQPTYMTSAEFDVMRDNAGYLLFNDDISAIGKLVPDIEDYPEDIGAHANVKTKYPSGGLIPVMNWSQFVSSADDTTDTEDLSGVIAILKRIETQVGLLDRTSEDLTDLENAINRFQFYANNILKVHDEGVFDSLTDIGTQLETIIAKIGIPSNYDELIGDFHWGPFKTKSEELGEELESLAPFGAIFLVSGMVETISSIAVISKPELHIPFKFTDQFGLTSEDIVIDVSWIDNAKPLINALMIFVLIMTLAGVSIKFIEIEVG